MPGLRVLHQGATERPNTDVRVPARNTHSGPSQTSRLKLPVEAADGKGRSEGLAAVAMQILCRAMPGQRGQGFHSRTTAHSRKEGRAGSTNL